MKIVKLHNLESSRIRIHSKIHRIFLRYENMYTSLYIHVPPPRKKSNMSCLIDAEIEILPSFIFFHAIIFIPQKWIKPPSFSSLKIGEQLWVQHRQVRGLLKGDLVDFAHYEEKITVGRPILGNWRIFIGTYISKKWIWAMEHGLCEDVLILYLKMIVFFQWHLGLLEFNELISCTH